MHGDGRLLAALRQQCDIVEIDSLADVERYTNGGDASVLLPASRIPPTTGRALADSASAVLQHLGDGVGVADAEGELVWGDDRLMAADEQVREQFVTQARRAIESFNSTAERSRPVTERRSRKFAFSTGQGHYEVVYSPATVSATDVTHVHAAVGVMWEVTASRRLQAKLDAIDAAGSELMNIRAETIGSMNNAQRLKLLEGKITHYVHELLNFDNFEVRILDRETKRLELVIAVGLTPLKIGETIYARETGNGISGYVAVKGESYLCPDVRNDPLYCEGLHNAASSLTVPLKLHDQVIGVFNIESYTPNQFTENDRKFAEIFGRYIAAAMNILDLLVVEQYTTNEQLTQNVLGELSEPLAEITSRALELKSRSGIDESLRASLDSLVQATESMRRRIEACTSGPRSVLGAEQTLRDGEPDPVMLGKRVLIADDEPVIRDTLTRILEQRGCAVTACKDGFDTIAAIDLSRNEHRPFDLVISDIRMPGRNGYEVFRAAKAVDRGTAVILMTGFGYDPNHSIVRANDEGLHSFLFKPFKASVLLESVSSALQRV